jgi:putative membrane protein
VILIGYEYIGKGLPIKNEWAPWVYALNCLFPLAICLLRDVYLAALFGGLATLLPFLLLWRYNPLSLKRAASVLRA